MKYNADLVALIAYGILFIMIIISFGRVVK